MQCLRNLFKIGTKKKKAIFCLQREKLSARFCSFIMLPFPLALGWFPLEPALCFKSEHQGFFIVTWILFLEATSLHKTKMHSQKRQMDENNCNLPHQLFSTNQTSISIICFVIKEVLALCSFDPDSGLSILYHVSCQRNCVVAYSHVVAWKKKYFFFLCWISWQNEYTRLAFNSHEYRHIHILKVIVFLSRGLWWKFEPQLLMWVYASGWIQAIRLTEWNQNIPLITSSSSFTFFFSRLHILLFMCFKLLKCDKYVPRYISVKIVPNWLFIFLKIPVWEFDILTAHKIIFNLFPR